jgi:hypothetical protein
MKNKLINCLKTIISDVRSAYVSLLLLSFLGLVSYQIPLSNISVENILPYVKGMLQLQVPLWWLVSLVFLVACLYIVPLLSLASKKRETPNEILILLYGSEKLSIGSISKNLNIEFNLARYHLENLQKDYLVKQVQVNPLKDEPQGYKLPGYQIEQKGIEHLFSHKLIKP